MNLRHSPDVIKTKRDESLFNRKKIKGATPPGASGAIIEFV